MCNIGGTVSKCIPGSNRQTTPGIENFGSHRLKKIGILMVYDLLHDITSSEFIIFIFRIQKSHNSFENSGDSCIRKWHLSFITASKTNHSN